MPRFPTPRVRFAIVCVLTYVALSFLVRFDMRRGEHIASLVYPLDTFSMYAHAAPLRTSYLVARDARGRVHAIESFRIFDCGGPVRPEVHACGRVRAVEYVDSALLHYVNRHRGRGEVQVDIVRQTWAIRAGTPPRRIGECVLARCRAAR